MRITRSVLLHSLHIPFTLSAQIVIRGNISDAETGEAIRNVIVSACNSTSTEEMITYTMSDQDGNYRLRLE